MANEIFEGRIRQRIGTKAEMDAYDTTGLSVGSTWKITDKNKVLYEWTGSTWGIYRPIKGGVTTIHNGISVTATGTEFDCSGYNAVLVSTLITGTGTWKIDIKGRLDSSDTVMDIYDNNDTQLTTGNLTVSRAKLFVAVPDLITILATEVVNGATCTVRVQPINI